MMPKLFILLFLLAVVWHDLPYKAPQDELCDSLQGESISSLFVSRTAWAVTLCSDRDLDLALYCCYSSLFREKYVYFMTHDDPFSLLYLLLLPLRKEIMSVWIN